MAKDKFITIRVDEKEKKEIQKTVEACRFPSISAFLIFLWTKFKNEPK